VIDDFTQKQVWSSKINYCGEEQGEEHTVDPPIDGKCKNTIDRQLDAIGPAIDIVILTIGGNDLNFANIAEKCCIDISFVPIFGSQWGGGSVADCVTAVADQQDVLAGGEFSNKYRNLLLAIIEKLNNNNSKIIVSSYPNLVIEDPTNRRNVAVRNIVKDATLLQKKIIEGVNEEMKNDMVLFYDDTATLFEGNEANAGIGLGVLPPVPRNEFILEPGRNTILFGSLASINQLYHPSPAGQAAWADGFEFFLRDVAQSQQSQNRAAIENDDFYQDEIVFLIDQSDGISDEFIEYFKKNIEFILSDMGDDVKVLMAIGIVGCQDSANTFIIESLTDNVQDLIGAVLSLKSSPTKSDCKPVLLSGLELTLREIPWSPGASKTIFAVVDSEPLLETDPTSGELREPITETTVDDIVHLSLDNGVKIDLVGRVGPEISVIASSTGGEIFEINPLRPGVGSDMGFANMVTVERAEDRVNPVAFLNEVGYVKIGEKFSFNAKGSYDPIDEGIAKYFWAFGGDMEYEVNTNEPIFDFVFESDYGALVTLMVETTDGRRSPPAVILVTANEIGTFPPPPDCRLDANGFSIFSDVDREAIDCVITNPNPKLLEPFDVNNSKSKSKKGRKNRKSKKDEKKKR